MAVASVNASAADLESLPVSDFNARWSGWGAINGFSGTDESSYAGLSIFAPLAQTLDTLTFIEIDSKAFEGDVQEGNLAVGHRIMSSSGFDFGLWGGIDVRKTTSDNVFGQVSGGLEALSTYFDARVNGYWSFSGSQTAADGVPDVILDGANIFMIGGQEVGMSGVDGEVGVRLPFTGNAGHLGIYGGGFWFDSADAYQAIAGPKARVELAWNDVIGPGSRITGEYQFSYDQVRGDRHQFGARLRIPLGPTPPAPDVSQPWLRMTDPLVRDTDIVLGQSNPEAVADGYTGVRLDQAAYANDGASLDAAIATGGTGANTLIILDGANGPVEGDKTLNAEQTLLGGGETLKVVGLENGVTSFLTAPGNRPTIFKEAGDGFALTLSDYNTVSGIDVTAQRLAAQDDAGLNIGGINGHDTHKVAIVDTNVTVGMVGKGIDESGAAGIVDSMVTGIDLADSDEIWLLGTHVEATMAGTGGLGPFAGVIGTGVNVSTGPVGVDNLENGNGGPGSNSVGSGTGGGSGNPDAESGGSGIVGGVVTGIALTHATQVHLADVTVVATMSGIAANANGAFGSGGSGSGNPEGTAGGIGSGGGTPPTGIGGTGGNGTGSAGNGGSGGMGGDGAVGIDGGTVVGIDLSGDARFIWMTRTTVTAAMEGRGASGGGADGANGAGGSGTGGVGGIGANLGGTGGTGTGNGGNGGMGGTGGAGGSGIVGGTLVGIDLSAAEYAWLTDTGVMATMSGFGGVGGDANGGNGGSGTGTGGTGGAGDPNVVVEGEEELGGDGVGGTGGTGIGNGGAGGAGKTGGNGGVGIDATSRAVGIALNGASSVALTGLSGAVELIGTGGDSGSANGGNGGTGTGLGGPGGDGVTGGLGGTGTGTGGAPGAAGTGGSQVAGVDAAAALFDIDFSGSSGITVSGETIGETVTNTPGTPGSATAGAMGASVSTPGDDGAP